MKGLLRKLPPFAPDYSGVNSVFHELGGLIIINGADGCIGNVNGYDEPRFFYNNPMIVSSGLREINAIVGDESILMKKIKDLGIEGEIPFVVLLGTPTSAVIASDHRGVGNLLNKETSIPVFCINTTGIDSYEIGAEKAFLSLAKEFVRPVPYRGGVNIIGCTPLDYWNEQQSVEMKEALTSEGVRINTCWSMGSDLENLKQTLAGDLNLVVSVSALKVAEYLKCEYGMSYIVGVPIGEVGTKRIVEEINSYSQTKASSDSLLKDKEDDSGLVETFIIGDQVWANSFRQYLKTEQNEKNISVLSFFTMLEDLMEKGDQKLNSEVEFIELVKAVRPKKIFGDPLYQRLIPKEANITYVDIPHLAVSSRLHWDHKILYVGKAVKVRKDD